jgi:hypothetical protein
MATYHKKTDQQAPKQLYSSAKNKGRYLSDNRKLTNPIQSKRVRTLKVPTISPQPIQRAMFYDPTSETYKRMKKHPDTGKYEEKEGPYDAKGDRKLTVLHQIAEKVRAAESNLDFGPHIAISIMGGKIYAGINEVYNSKKPAITKELENTKKRTTALISEKSKLEELKEKPAYKIKRKDSEIKSSSEKEKRIEKHISQEKLV